LDGLNRKILLEPGEWLSTCAFARFDFSCHVSADGENEENLLRLPGKPIVI